VNTDDLTTPITGQFESPLKGIIAGDLFKDIRNAHYNINSVVEQRNMQRQKLAEKSRKQASAAPKQSE
jgi:hypothetical protein